MNSIGRGIVVTLITILVAMIFAPVALAQQSKEQKPVHYNDISFYEYSQYRGWEFHLQKRDSQQVQEWQDYRKSLPKRPLTSEELRIKEKSAKKFPPVIEYTNTYEINLVFTLAVTIWFLAWVGTGICLTGKGEWRLPYFLIGFLAIPISLLILGVLTILMVVIIGIVIMVVLY